MGCLVKYIIFLIFNLVMHIKCDAKKSIAWPVDPFELSGRCWRLYRVSPETDLRHHGTVVCLGGGIGAAPIYPIAKAQRDAGNTVITVMGSRTKDLLFWTDRLAGVSDAFYTTTDDGSAGKKGFAVDVLRDLVTEGRKIDLAYAIGPVRMMQASSAVAKQLGVPMLVSLNPIMVDGTGMCGGCRVYVGGARCGMPVQKARNSTAGRSILMP